MRLLAQQTIDQVFGKVTPPPALGDLNKASSGSEAISIVIGNIINLIYGVAAIVCIFMILFAGFQWITSGGDKEAVAKARGRITWAIIGITVLALSAVILHILGGILNIRFFNTSGLISPCTGGTSPVPC